MNTKENLLRAIYFEDPEYLPRSNEQFAVFFEFEGNYKLENWVDRWGVQWSITLPNMAPFPKGNPLPNLDYLDEYVFPDPDGLEFTEDHKRLLSNVNRNERLVYGKLTLFMFERAYSVMGLDNFMKSFFTHPKELKRLLHEIADFNIRVFERYLEIGVDGIYLSDDLGHQRGPMFSPEFFREFFVPEYKRCFDLFVRERKIVHLHSCGCIQDFVEDLIDTGVTVLNPVQARANDLASTKKKCDGKMVLQGAVDSHLLMLEPVEKIQTEVKRVIDILAPGGGYIIGPDQSMPFPKDNIGALWSTAQSYGKYSPQIPILSIE